MNGARSRLVKNNRKNLEESNPNFRHVSAYVWADSVNPQDIPFSGRDLKPIRPEYNKVLSPTTVTDSLM